MNKIHFSLDLVHSLSTRSVEIGTITTLISWPILNNLNKISIYIVV